MTNADVMAQILSEATGRSLAEVQHLVFELAQGFGDRTNLGVELTDAEASVLIATLRQELPGIQQWLIDGALMTLDEMRNSTKH